MNLSSQQHYPGEQIPFLFGSNFHLAEIAKFVICFMIFYFQEMGSTNKQSNILSIYGMMYEGTLGLMQEDVLTKLEELIF